MSLTFIPIQCKCQHQVGCDNRRALKIHGLPALILQVVDLQHCGVHVVGGLGEEVFEVGKERWVVECPFRSFLASLVNVAT